MLLRPLFEIASCLWETLELALGLVGHARYSALSLAVQGTPIQHVEAEPPPVGSAREQEPNSIQGCGGSTMSKLSGWHHNKAIQNIERDHRLRENRLTKSLKRDEHDIALCRMIEPSDPYSPSICLL